MISLPIDPILPDIVEKLRKSPRLVLEAPPGAGKTTRVPRALLDAGFATSGEIVVLEPRRLAARMAAKRVAEELGEALGETVGYQVRFEEVASKKTRIRFVTEGILTRMLLGDLSLPGVAAVILDEFHERHLQGDLALALLATARPNLPLVVMSATLDAGPIAAHLGAPIIRAEGRRFDVTISHLPSPDDRPLASQVASAVRSLVQSNDPLEGDILVFLPGAYEIREAARTCEKIASEANLLVLPLHGELPPAEQDRAIGRADRRKVILSTNVAESSLTIEGVVAVIDSGLARTAGHAAWSGLSTLETSKISRASAVQRAGRAGRTRAGQCVRLYTRADFDSRDDHDKPEIARLDLAATVLGLRAAGIGDAAWLDPPPPRSLTAATSLLTRLGALSKEGSVTALGRKMATLPLHPRHARVLIAGVERGVAEEACLAVALLGEREIRSDARARFDGPGGGAKGQATELSDLVARMDLFREAKESRFSPGAMRAIGLDTGATMGVERARLQLERLVRRGGRSEGVSDWSVKADTELARALLSGYPDRVARRIRPGGRGLVIAGRINAELAESSVVRDALWMVALDADDKRGRTVSVRIASAIEPDWLLDLASENGPGSTEVVCERTVEWNSDSERVVAVERMIYDGLTVDESLVKECSGEDVSAVLAKAAIEKGPSAFTPKDALDRWLARARFAAPFAKLKVPDDAFIHETLIELCEGRSSFKELREASLLEALKAHLGPKGAVAIDKLAPERVTFKMGRTALIVYEEGRPPWTESFLQDFFGMVASPTVGDGSVPLVLHLLAPNKTAVQVTRDLEGFWDRHYATVRKEMMRQYPRHSWPEDPTLDTPRFRPRTPR